MYYLTSRDDLATHVTDVARGHDAERRPVPLIELESATGSHGGYLSPRLSELIVLTIGLNSEDARLLEDELMDSVVGFPAVPQGIFHPLIGAATMPPCEFKVTVNRYEDHGSFDDTWELLEEIVKSALFDPFGYVRRDLIVRQVANDTQILYEHPYGRESFDIPELDRLVTRISVHALIPDGLHISWGNGHVTENVLDTRVTASIMLETLPDDYIQHHLCSCEQAVLYKRRELITDITRNWLCACEEVHAEEGGIHGKDSTGMCNMYQPYVVKEKLPVANGTTLADLLDLREAGFRRFSLRKFDVIENAGHILLWENEPTFMGDLIGSILAMRAYPGKIFHLV